MYLSKNRLISFYNERKMVSLQCNINHINAMARPIKETPVVTGKDAKRFAEKWQISNLKARKRKKPQRKFMRSSKPLLHSHCNNGY